MNNIINELRKILLEMKCRKLGTVCSYLAQGLFLLGIMSMVSIEKNMTVVDALSLMGYFVISAVTVSVVSSLEDDMRKGKFEYLLHENKSFVKFIVGRMTAFVIMNVLAFVIIFSVIMIVGKFNINSYYDVSVLSVVAYSIYTIAVTLIISLFFVWLVLRYRRVAAGVGIVTYYVLFYSGLVFGTGKYAALGWLRELVTGVYGNILIVSVCILLIGMGVNILINKEIYNIKVMGRSSHN